MKPSLPEQMWRANAERMRLASDKLERSVDEALEFAHAAGWSAEICKPWSVNAREKQRPPQEFADGHADFWLLRTGRGFGKTWALSGNGCERWKDGTWRRTALIAPTQADVRHTMIEGESGILEMAAAEGIGATYFPSLNHQVRFENGAKCFGYSDEKPGRVRGPSRDSALCDELREWRNGTETWDNLIRILRLGEHPQIIAASTPPGALSKRPITYETVKWMKWLESLPNTVVTTGSSIENLDNLSPSYRRVTIDPYVGTRIGRLEVDGEYAEDVEGALWSSDMIDNTRIKSIADMPDLVSVAVGVDPPGSTATECGIVAAGVDRDGHAYVFLDFSMKGLPPQWGQAVIDCVRASSADCAVAESNYGGDMVVSTINVIDAHVSVNKVSATRGKAVRAQPVSTLWERERASIVGVMPNLEDELCTWTTDSPTSPNRLDALVWAVTFVALQMKPMISRAAPRRRKAI